MESNWVDTSLSFDLNTRPLQPQGEPQMSSTTDFMQLGGKIAIKREAGVLEAELNRVTEENEKLNTVLGVVCQNFRSLQNQMFELMNKASEGQTPWRKRKQESLEINDIKSNETKGNINHISHVESSSSEDSCKKQCRLVKTKISKAYVRTEPSDSTLVVKDGYQWRKYGQKVTRDNPSPRAYFKCSYAPACPVKKKVQRSVEDRSILVATYEGEHTHPNPSQADRSCGSSHGGASSPVPCSVSVSSSGPTVTLDLTQTGLGQDAGVAPQRDTNSPEFQRFLAEQMAATLSKDPGFTTALATAISGRILKPSPAERW
ncbi:probable WRKY transcription factor 40 [Magnolia sinica]|uniref:probable WRKY transcription factor 40 n=1 Tax=Magnolia sinica TaxID=86752 RepID=UPI00265AA1B1|nr:probable WRKY transcription factor 40 [Magnolia sinica]